MKLPFLDKKEKIEYFFAILLRDDRVKVIIFEEIEKKIKVIGSHVEQFPTNLEAASFEEWLSVFDKAIGTAESMLPESVNLQKTVFGVKESWVEDAKIKKEYLSKLKKVCEELDLHPIGFLVFSEAIAHLLQKEEGAPVSSILVESGDHTVTITILRAGKIVETKSATLTTSLVQTVDVLLKEITSMEIFPSRIILFDGEDVKHEAQQFIGHQWSKSLPFLHMPQITVLPPDFDAKAILYGTAQQLGFAVSDTTITHATSLVATPIESSQKTTEAHTPEDIALPVPANRQRVAEEITPFLHQNFGFIHNEDIAQKKEPVKETLPQEEQDVEDTVEDFQAETITDPLLQEDSEERAMPRKTPSIRFAFMSNLSSLFGKLKFRKRQRDTNHNESRRKNPLKIFLGAVVLGIILCGGLVIYYLMQVRAVVTLVATPKHIDQDEKITFSTENNTDFSQNILQGKNVSVTETGDVNAQTTGTKEVGTPAKGAVTIFNNNDTTKTLSSGTTITSSNGLKFTLDKDVSIASASGDIFSGTKPGTADVAVTAAGIGTDSNLPSNTTFSVGSSSSVAAKNSNAFSGGTKKNITVASKDDMNKLIAEVTKNLESKAQDDMIKNAISGNAVVPVILTSDVQKKEFDKNSGDEATSITLHATVAYTGVSYDTNQVTDFGKHILQDKIARDMLKGITYEIHDASVKNDKNITGTLSLHATIVPTLDTQTVPRQITGKSFTDAKHILLAFPQVSDVKITLSPNLFIPMLPMMSNHISITVQTND